MYLVPCHRQHYHRLQITMPSETVPSAAPRLSPLLLLVQNTTTQKETIKDRFKECNRARENRNIRTETHRHRRRKCYRHALYLPMMSMTNRTKPKIHKNRRRYGIVREVGLPQSKNAAPWWSFATRAQSIISFSDT